MEKKAAEDGADKIDKVFAVLGALSHLDRSPAVGGNRVGNFPTNQERCFRPKWVTDLQPLQYELMAVLSLGGVGCHSFLFVVAEEPLPPRTDLMLNKDYTHKTKLTCSPQGTDGPPLAGVRPERSPRCRLRRQTGRNQ